MLTLKNHTTKWKIKETLRETKILLPNIISVIKDLIAIWQDHPNTRNMLGKKLKLGLP